MMVKRQVMLLIVVFTSVCVLAQKDSSVVRAKVLEQVDVTAQKSLDCYRSSVPKQTLDSASFLRMGIHDMTSALHHVAGITVRDYGGAGGMKTVSVRGLGAHHTAVLYDGIVQSNIQNGEEDLSRYSLNQAVAVTLTIGDGDDIFQPARNAAAAATLSIQTLMPPKELHTPQLYLGCTTGSWGMVNPSCHYGQNISSQWILMAQGEYFHADNNYPFTLKNIALETREHRHNSKMNSGRGEVGTVWYGQHDQMLGVKVYYDDSYRRLPGIVRYYTSLNDEALGEKKMSGQLHYRRAFGNLWNLKVCAQYNNMLTDYRNETLGSAIRSAGYHQREEYGSAAVLYEPFDWLSTSASVDVFNNVLHGTGSVRKPVRNSVLGAFSMKMKRDRLQLIARAVGAWYQDKAEREHSYERRLSPSVSLSYQPVKTWPLRIRMMYKEMFRMPAFSELYFFHLGSLALAPEKTKQWNVGLSWNSRLTDGLRVGLTADTYLNHVADKIVAIPFNTFVWRMQNLARVRSKGLDVTAEAAWEFLPSHQLLLNGNYSWQEVENKTDSRSVAYGKQVAYTPAHTWCATLTWMNPWACMTWTMNGQSCRWATNEHTQATRMAGFAECDLSLWRTLLLGHTECTFRAALLNLLDRQYEIVAHYPMPGRSWRLSLIVKI